MATLFDYLDWRGDLPIRSEPAGTAFCDIDNLLLAELSFVDFSEIVPSDFTNPISMRDAEKRYSELHPDETVKLMVSGKMILPMFRKMAESERFGSVLLLGYRNQVDTERESQFAALTAILGDGTLFIVFRGTDDTLIGWKEDFNMAFLDTIPAQICARDYVDEVAAFCPERIRIGGHSKGGNLAVYAAANAASEVQKRIIRVYNNDGPGFSRAMLDSEGYGKIRDRITTIVPHTSVVGMLLEHEESYTVVSSTQTGLFQHDGFSWEVLGTNFVKVEDRSEESKFVDRTLKSWLAGIGEEERMRIVEALYSILSATNAQTLSELSEEKSALLKSIRSITPEQRELLQKMIHSLLKEGRKTLQRSAEEKKQLQQMQHLQQLQQMQKEEEPAKYTEANTGAVAGEKAKAKSRQTSQSDHENQSTARRNRSQNSRLTKKSTGRTKKPFFKFFPIRFRYVGTRRNGAPRKKGAPNPER